MQRLFLTALFVAAFCALAIGADLDQFNVCYGTLDSDYDGALTSEEFQETFPGATAVFAEADGDGNGTVSHEEWEAWKASKGFEENH